MRNEELGTKIKRADIVALKNQAEKLFYEIAEEYKKANGRKPHYKTIREEYEALAKREAAQTAYEHIAGAIGLFEYLEALE